MILISKDENTTPDPLRLIGSCFLVAKGVNMDFRQLSSAEQIKVIPLLAKCFPVWQKHLADTEYPFESTAFVAEENGKFVAHCSVVKFDISDGAGRVLPLGGLASVATDPDYRHRGLAETLCRLAIDYAQGEKLVALPLFTSFPRVYAKNNWREYPVFMPQCARWKNHRTPGKWRSGTELSEVEKQQIIAIYDTGFDFPGKVMRVCGNTRSVFGWKRFFAANGLATAPGFYGAGGDNIVSELNGDPGAPGAREFLLSLPRKNNTTIFALPESSPFWPLIGECAELSPAQIGFHGPMVLDLTPENFFQNHRKVYFSLPDRF